jgi:hypothetical protein
MSVVLPAITILPAIAISTLFTALFDVIKGEILKNFKRKALVKLTMLINA